MTLKNHKIQDIPLKIVGGSEFGRYPKISVEQTWNMIISDGFLVPYAGYKKVIDISTKGEGRAIFNSEKLGKLIIVINNIVYSVDNNFQTKILGSIDTYSGDVFIDENIAKQIAICDQQDIWIYNYSTEIPTFKKASLNFTPGYIAFQDGYFIAPVQGTSQWRLSGPNDGYSWPVSSQTVGGFQTKPDNVVAAFRMPSKGNLLMVMGNTVTEAWVNVGAALFPYQRSSQYNIDYGCLNPATIATSDQFAVWLGVNEKSGPVILASDGGPPQQISSEGWNFRFSQLKYPEQSYGFLFKQDGHLIYQLTFYHPEDNLSLIYDFSTKMFFNVSDLGLNCHIAKRIAFFNKSYYFVSLVDGNLYELSTKYYNLDGVQMPMIRITPTFRTADNVYFVINNITFILEQGVNQENTVNVPVVKPFLDNVITNEGNVVSNIGNVTSIDYSSNDNQENLFNFEINHLPTTPRVDLCLSKDGGETFSNNITKWMRPIGFRKNRINYWQLGIANEVVVQLRFQGNQRFVVSDGVMSIYR